MTVAPDGTVEFSRKLRLDRLAAGDVVEAITANEAERAALARRFALGGLARLSARLRVRRPAQGPLIRVEGELTATVTQTCVVTLEPVESRVDQRFVQLYTLEGPAQNESEVFVGPDDEEIPEPLEGETLDLGELAAEQLSLALDPYPRAPGARFEGASFGEDGEVEEDAEESPFAVLKQLRNDG